MNRKARLAGLTCVVTLLGSALVLGLGKGKGKKTDTDIRIDGIFVDVVGGVATASVTITNTTVSLKTGEGFPVDVSAYIHARTCEADGWMNENGEATISGAESNAVNCTTQGFVRHDDVPIAADGQETIVFVFSLDSGDYLFDLQAWGEVKGSPTSRTKHGVAVAHID